MCIRDRYYKANGDIDADRTHILSTEGMVLHAQQHPTRSFVVATELGIMHRLSKEAPQGRFYAASERAVFSEGLPGGSKPRRW